MSRHDDVLVSAVPPASGGAGGVGSGSQES